MAKIMVRYQHIRSFLPTKRHRKPRHMKLQNACEVEILEPSEAEFPVAFVITERKSVYYGAQSYKEMMQRRDSVFVATAEENRVYQGRLYEPVHISYGTAISDQYEGLDWLANALYAYDGYCCDVAWLFSEKSVITGDTEEQQIALIRHEAERYLWFHGKVWETVHEPMYVVQTFGLGHNHGGTAGFITRDYNPNIPAGNYFNALRREEAIAYGRLVALSRGDTNYVDKMFDDIDIEVRMPEMVKANPQAEHGDGDPWQNKLESFVRNSDSPMEAGIMALLATAELFT